MASLLASEPEIGAVEGEILPGSKRAVQIALLRHYRYASFDRIGIVYDVDAGDGGRPRGRLDPGSQDTQCRGLAGTVGSQKSEDFAVLDGEVDPLKCVRPAPTILLGRFLDVDHGCSGRRSEEHTSELQSRRRIVCR